MSRQIGELTSRRVGKSRRGESITDSEAKRNRLYQTIRTQRQGLVHPSTRPLVYYTMRGIILRETETAESRKSIALGNAQRNELRLSPSSPERAKSFANNRLLQQLKIEN